MPPSKPAPRPAVSVVVLGYNNQPYLEEALSSILAQKGAEFEVLFVDNASSDGSAEFVKKRFPQIRLISSPSNLGYAGGNNLGAREARGEYLVIVNPDVVAPAGWLSGLYKAAVSACRDSGAGSIFCSKVLLASDPSKINSTGVFLSKFGFCGSWGDGRPAGEFDAPLPLLAPTGCSFIISRGTFLGLGGFDEKFFMYAEDLDLGWRAANRGIPTYLAPASTLLHKYKSVGGRPAPYFQLSRNQLWAIRKNEKGPKKIMLLAASKVFYLSLSIAQLVFLRPAASLAIWKGLWAGFFTPIKKDANAGGEGRKLVLGFGPTLPMLFLKIRKHSK